MHAYSKNVEQYIYKFAKVGLIKEDRTGGNGEDAAPPQKAEYGTQGVYTGQHASCDHMKHRLRQSRDNNGKRGEAQISQLQWKKRFSELKKGLVRTLVENMCQFLLTKTCRYKSRSEKDKNQETAKTNEPNKHEVHTFYVLH